MHVLGHGFSQRRKSPKPRDLHIRKVSFSGCSLSSGGSFSSASSSSTARPLLSGRSAASLDPLALNPTFQPPPRLHDRPLLSPERPWRRPRFETAEAAVAAAATFFDDGSSDDDDAAGYCDDDAADYFGRAGALYAAELELPPHVSPMDHDAGHDAAAAAAEPHDFVLRQLATRPPLPRSHWSESTVHTLDSLAAGGEGPDADADADAMGCLAGLAPPPPQQGHLSMPDLGAAPRPPARRPPMKTLDGVEDFIKRGGWKRRGIVFNSDDMAGPEGLVGA